MAAPRQTRTTRLDPALSEPVRIAEQAWTTAEAEPDLEKQLALWEAAAIAFTAVDGDANVKREAARAATLAWSNAVDAANKQLDAYNRAQEYDKAAELADAIAKDAKLLRDHADLATVVHQIQYQAARKRADELKGDAAGAAYRELYNAAPESRDGDALLYNAAVSYETDHSIALALEMYAQVQKHYPTSKLTPRALARAGRLYADIAFFDKAAEKLEEYGKKYAGEKDAYDAMSDAAYFRRALGDRAKATEDTAYVVKTFGAKQPRGAADAMWSLTTLYEAEPDRAIAHLRDYVRVFGGKGGTERVVIAYAKIGQALWKQSCPAPLVDGLCVKANEHAVRTCGVGTARTQVAIARDPRKAREAGVAFASARAEFERQRIDDPAARYYYAQARLAMADGELESALAIVPPTSARGIEPWVEARQRAVQGYEGVFAAKDAASSIDAAERLAVTIQSVASALVTTKVKACDVAAPLESRAIRGFEICLVKSTELGWFSEASARCERELERLRPDDFPPARELRGRPLAVAPLIDVEPPVP